MDAANMSIAATLEGFESIFKENYSPLFRYVNSIVKDQELAKDVLSDLFLHLWLRKDTLKISNLKSYLFRSARNGAIRTISAQPDNLSLPEEAFDIPADTYNPFEKFVAKQSIQIIRDLINQLPALRKEMIELRLLGLKNSEIAEALDIPEKKVEYNMREAIEQLSRSVNNSNLDKAALIGSAMLIQLIFHVI